MWMDAFWNSRLDRAKRSMGFLRGAMDYAVATRRDVISDPPSDHWEALLSDSELQKLIQGGHNEGRILYQA